MIKNTKHKKLSGGGSAYAVAFKAHGMVSVVGSCMGGSGAAGSEELAQIHAQMLMGGTMRHSKKEIQIMLDSWGASLSFDAGVRRLRFSARVPVKYLDDLVGLIAEIVREPAFATEELAILKKREEAALTMELQDTREQARIALSRLIYPRTHRNYSESTTESQKILARITPAMLIAFHAKTHGTQSLVVVFAGDVNAPKVFASAERHFKTLPKRTGTTKNTSAVRPTKARKEAVSIKHKASIDYMVGCATGITDTHPDYPALIVGIQALGNAGGFTGRLMSTVREEEGLTYGVYAFAQQFNYCTDGLVYVWGTFAPQLFAKGRAAIKREIKKMVDEGVGEHELRRHAELFAARTTVRLSNSGAIAGAVHDTIVNNKPLSYIDELPKKVLKLTTAQVNKVLKKYLILEKMSESAAGPVEKNVFSS